ncbi:hypothetical protein N7519_001446 [Penicillium mononematosum]|uniref:uncharacterized protein n=1 Tax=Penicillium mononematosum TaxID=268346 RepID=UPI0025470859|nr:uncharacterized protein N7519_001446 [Penicillium mononematosum]KAJ6191425.1 hypothetical protein N7519_001446 [Penicillium mononematosum]
MQRMVAGMPRSRWSTLFDVVCYFQRPLCGVTKAWKARPETVAIGHFGYFPSVLSFIVLTLMRTVCGYLPNTKETYILHHLLVQQAVVPPPKEREGFELV